MRVPLYIIRFAIPNREALYRGLATIACAELIRRCGRSIESGMRLSQENKRD
jgi:hypothetical protein